MRRFPGKIPQTIFQPTRFSKNSPSELAMSGGLMGFVFSVSVFFGKIPQRIFTEKILLPHY